MTRLLLRYSLTKEYDALRLASPPARASRLAGDALERGEVVRDDFGGGRDAVVNVVRLGPGLQDGAQLVVVVPGHGREQVVLQLRVHAAPDPRLERTEHRVRVARAAELALHVLGALAVLHDLLALVRHGDDGRRDEARQPDAEPKRLRRQEGAEGRPVHREPRRLPNPRSRPSTSAERRPSSSTRPERRPEHQHVNSQPTKKGIRMNMQEMKDVHKALEKILRNKNGS